MDSLSHSLLPSNEFADRVDHTESLIPIAMQIGLSAIGPGMLTLPFGMYCLGWPLTIAMLAFATYISAVAVLMIFDAQEQQSKREARKNRIFNPPNTYGELVKAVLGQKYSYYLDVILVINGCGTAICFITFLGGFTPPAFRFLLEPDLNENGTISRHLRAITLVILCSLCILFSYKENFSSYQWLGFLPICGLGWTLLTLLYKALPVIRTSPPNNFPAVSSGSKPQHMLMAINLFLFSTMMHTNVIPIIRERPNLTRQQLKKCLQFSHGTLFVLYTTLAILGILAASPYGSIKQNFTVQLPNNDPGYVLMRLILTVGLLGVTPYLFIATTTGIIDLWNGTHSIGTEVLIHSPLQRAPNVSASTKSRIIATSALIGTSLLIALNTDSVATILSFTGGVGATTLMCAFPAFLTAKSSEPHHIFERYLMWFVSIVGYGISVLDALSIC